MGDGVLKISLSLFLHAILHKTLRNYTYLSLNGLTNRLSLKYLLKAVTTPPNLILRVRSWVCLLLI